MKILTRNQIKEADRFTIEHEPIQSIDLMERASTVLADQIVSRVGVDASVLFLIGKGNNGGDGLAVARLLNHKGMNCTVCLPFDRDQLSEECRTNLDRLPLSVSEIEVDMLHTIPADMWIVDALLGSGVRGVVKKPLAALITTVNDLPNPVIAIDLPSGMRTEFGNAGQIIVRADITLTIQSPKLAMLLPEAGEYVGEMIICPIGIDVEEDVEQFDTPYSYLTQRRVKGLLKKRRKFAHKGTYGHALLICGSKGMCGSAILATGAALRSGCGLVTLHIPYEERMAVQTRYPSAMLSLDSNICFSQMMCNLDKYTSLGIGSGLGQNWQTVESFGFLLKSFTKPMVIDADALNIIASRNEWITHIPAHSILTPHLGELWRLVGEWKDEEHKLALVKELAFATTSVVVVKGAYTMICLPDGRYYFNSTGNSGMAKGGSGDVLLGYITGLLAHGYASADAAILGVYLHGLAGDIAAVEFGEESMNSDDLISYLPQAMKQLSGGR